MEPLKGYKTYAALAGVALIGAVLALNGVLHFLSPDLVQTLQWLAGICAAAAGAAYRLALADNTAKTEMAVEQAEIATRKAEIVREAVQANPPRPPTRLDL